ncbi:uncharacterized protein LOC141939875 [Strix uralensis]|uniref:uncharacterized protein LOC141939875 n=1 Tax=Strix uralensis TaxID=36305 RepID=UPI003DA23ABE
MGPFQCTRGDNPQGWAAAKAPGFPHTHTPVMLPRSCWVLQLFCATAGFLGWLGLGIPPEEMGVPPELGAPPEVGNPPHIPLEMTAGDDQFQTEATCWDLSPLDSCHHQVVAWLRSSCANLSEEEEEVNCQTSAEGHRTYPCTPNMEELQEELAGWLWPRLETPGHRRLQRPVPDETLVANEQHQVAQLLEDTSQQMERDLALLAQIEEMMEKLQQVNRSLGLMLAAVEDARSQLENHPQHLHAVLDPAGAISTSILCGSCLVLLAMLLVLTPPHAILLHFFFLTSSTLSIPALSALLAFTMAGQWLVAAARRGAGGARLVFPQEEPGHWFTSTPDRECNMDLLREELDRMEMSCLQGAAGAGHGHWEALGAQTLQPNSGQWHVLAVPAVPVPGGHQGWAAMPEESHPRAGLLPHPHHWSSLLQPLAHRLIPSCLTPSPLPKRF